MALNLNQKLAILADAAKYDASCASSGSKTQRKGKGIGSTEGMGICHSYTPDGRCISLLKILLTNYCIFDCKYCINRVSSNVKRARFKTEDVVYLTLEFYKRNYIEGLFLSSGIIQDSDYTMEQLVRVAKELRLTHGYKGYIHLKTIPGANDEILTEAGLYADRLSINIELPTEDDLKNLAPEKNIRDLENNMSRVSEKITENRQERKQSKGRKKKKPAIFTPAGQSTQMIVGATPTADRTILQTASSLYNKHQLRRVYYSAFSPIPDAHSGLPSKNPPLMREHRLYQADWLLRFYGFNVGEITPEHMPELRLDIDPKAAWAINNREFFPIDVNTASKEALLRIPGIGARSVQKIISMRRYKKIRLDDLKKLRCALNRLKPFIVTKDYSPRVLADQESIIHLINPPNKQLEMLL